MSEVAVHWLDAGVLIQAANRYYRFDLVPKFWDFLDAQLDIGTVRMSRLTYDEILSGNDDLATWCKKRKTRGLCVSPSKTVQEHYGKVTAHVNSLPKYKTHHVAEFLRGADGWVIAHAWEDKGIVVTEELTTGTASKIKVPTVAKALGVKWCNTFDMLKTLEAKFS
jgi:hypothetical protein